MAGLGLMGTSLGGFASSVRADPYTMRRRFEALTSGQPLQRGCVLIELPQVADNGHSVPMGLRFEPRAGDTVPLKRVVVLSDQNPREVMFSVECGPALAVPAWQTRVRLNGSQRVTVLMQQADGRWWTDDRWVDVTESACLDPTG